MRIKQLLILTLVSISLFAQAQTIDELSNKFWRLKVATINGMVYDFSNNISDAPTMQFSGGNIRGNGGCNAYHTKFTLNNNSIEFGNILSTRMACANLSLNEAVYFQALSQLHLIEYFPGRNELIFTNQSGDKLTYYSQFSRSENSYTPPPPPSRNYNSDEDNSSSYSRSRHSRYKHGKKLSRRERLRLLREEREEARKNKKSRSKKGKKLSKKERLKMEKEERLQAKKDKKKKGKKGKRDNSEDEKPTKKSKKDKKSKKESNKDSKKSKKDKKGKDKKKK
jgi:heat shock protein HslJ